MSDTETAAAEAESMWCDDFDADLLKVVPGAAEALGDTAGITLETFSGLTNGKINHPAAWNTDGGLVSFFWTDPDFRPWGCHTSKPVAECTFLEAVRDEWVHSCAISVNGHIVWRPPVRLMERLMFDLRGWAVLSDEERERTRRQVLDALERAAASVRRAVGAGK